MMACNYNSCIVNNINNKILMKKTYDRYWLRLR